MNKKILYGLGAVILFPILLIIFFSGNESTPKPAEEVQAVQPAAPAYAFDIPSLLGQDIDALKQTLGAPTEDSEPTAAQLQLGTDTWEKSWTKGEYDLMATYDVKTKKVVDLFLSTNTDAAFASFKDTDNILKIGNLEKSNSRYSVEFVKANKGGYTGVIVRAI